MARLVAACDHAGMAGVTQDTHPAGARTPAEGAPPADPAPRSGGAHAASGPSPRPTPSAAAGADGAAGRRRRRRRWHVDAVPERGLVSGVAAGVALQLGVPTAVVRVAFLVLTAAGGAGAIAYLALWVVAVPVEDAPPAPSGPVARRRALALIPLLLGVLLLLRTFGLWFGDGLVWPVALAGLGALVIGARGDDDGDVGSPDPSAARFRLPDRVLSGQRSRAVLRVAVGAVLVALGMVLLLAAIDSLTVLGDVLPALAVTVIGLGLIVGPVIYRLVGQLNAERTDRIRSQERALMAAHLHDSVLQTLAMIQRSGSSREMTTLARAQERELRAWLFDEREQDEDQTLRGGIDDLVARVEARHHVTVDAVVVGDVTVTEPVHALIDACGEAVTNAANHADVGRVSVYVEVEPGVVTAFVRDEGTGFDPGAVPADRRGISHSICDRLERHGGAAELTTEPGSGTEWELSVPLRSGGRRSMTGDTTARTAQGGEA